MIDISNGSMEIYPNPAKEMATIRIKGVQGEVLLTIVDMSGRTVKESVMKCNDNNSTAIELRDLPSGTYFVRASADGINLIRKLVVK